MDSNGLNNVNPNLPDPATNQTPGTPNQPGKGSAVASLVLGIVSVVFWFFGAGAVVGIVTGIIGLICASSARKAGYEGGMRTAGFVCSIIGLVGSALVFVSCVACVGALGSLGLSASDLTDLY